MRVAIVVVFVAVGWQAWSFARAAEREASLAELDASGVASVLSRALRSGAYADRAMARRVHEADPLVALDAELGVGAVARGRRVALIGGASVQFDFVVGRVLALPSGEDEFVVLIGALDESDFHVFRYALAPERAPAWSHERAWYSTGEPTDLDAWRTEPWWPDPWSPYDAADVALDEDLVERFVENLRTRRGEGTSFAWLVDEVSGEIDGPVARRAAARRVLEAAAARAPDVVVFDGVSRVALRRPMRTGPTDDVGMVDLVEPSTTHLWSAEPGERIEDLWFDGDTLVLDCSRHWRGSRRVVIPWRAGEQPIDARASVEWL